MATSFRLHNQRPFVDPDQPAGERQQTEDDKMPNSDHDARPLLAWRPTNRLVTATKPTS